MYDAKHYFNRWIMTGQICMMSNITGYISTVSSTSSLSHYMAHQASSISVLSNRTHLHSTQH